MPNAPGPGTAAPPQSRRPGPAHKRIATSPIHWTSEVKRNRVLSAGGSSHDGRNDGCPAGFSACIRKGGADGRNEGRPSGLQKTKRPISTLLTAWECQTRPGNTAVDTCTGRRASGWQPMKSRFPQGLSLLLYLQMGDSTGGRPLCHCHGRAVEQVKYFFLCPTSSGRLWTVPPVPRQNKTGSPNSSPARHTARVRYASKGCPFEIPDQGWLSSSVPASAIAGTLELARDSRIVGHILISSSLQTRDRGRQ